MDFRSFLMRMQEGSDRTSVYDETNSLISLDVYAVSGIKQIALPCMYSLMQGCCFCTLNLPRRLRQVCHSEIAFFQF